MQEPSSARTAIAGLLTLAVAMGIGRFAFTPLLPMMMADGVVDIGGASWLATANYLGHLLGAAICIFYPLFVPRPVNAPAVVRRGLVVTTALTLAMALPWPALWPLWRFAAGVASALVLIHATSWCLGQLAQQGAGHVGAVMYAGPGAGMVVGGLAASAMVAAGWRSNAGWLGFGVVAVVLTALVWPSFDPALGKDTGARAQKATQASGERAHGTAEFALFAANYGISGFGYIITATFLPVIAREALPASPWLDMFWPIFGAAVVVGALAASRIRTQGDARTRLAVCFAIQSVGVAVGLLSPTVAGFAIGCVLLGLPFTAITFFATQEVRRLRPHNVAAYVGVITISFGVGQTLGPPLAAALVARSGSASQGFALSLWVAAGVLAFGAVVYAAMARVFTR
ncbi:YbfB/YjiJ family MFS transporter [Ramlibacter albus]|uniref:YbfB/YjiJ family MFS transporter n=1 Tax=Ramlibacter albus TaxID=2079448 RepID=A0A923MGK7_9BURK|nr:YbfB/YjiJ family MFS transporter [Ramlibacter albus]MBC5768587.1 YbfB/YjiJ family MFS transporter [Ramlibacter albus]